MLVLSESRGTCGTTHALLAALAEQAFLPVELMLASYMMSEENTPGVGPVLQAHGLSEIPEAHCYLRYGETRVDMTFPAHKAASGVLTSTNTSSALSISESTKSVSIEVCLRNGDKVSD